MTCCIGKARIYFKEPIGYWLTYQMPDGSFGSVTASEPLTSSCFEVPGQTPGQIMVVMGDSPPRDSSDPIGTDTRAWYSGPAPLSVTNVSDAPAWPGTPYQISGTDANGNWSTNTPSWSDYRLKPIIYIVPQDPEESPEPTFTFKVIGEETGTVYREIGGLDECPTVISNICLMEEGYVDVEMGSGLPLLPSFVPDCLVAITGFPLPENTIQIRKIRVNPPSINPLKPKLPETVLTLTGLPGCPAEFRIECNPEEKCPPDTDCSLDCDGLVCCYKDGKVIKSFRK
jgi:hypothetical protein